MATVTAVKNVDKQLADERRERIATEQRRLDRIAESKLNEQRHAQIVRLQRARIAETVAAGSVAEFTIPDPDAGLIYRVRVMLSHEEASVRATARTAIVALAHLFTMLESERIEAARIGGATPDVGRRLASVLDADGCRQAAAYGALVCEQRTA